MSEKHPDLGDQIIQITHLIRQRSRELPMAPHQARALRIIGHGDIRPARLAETLMVTPRAVTDVVDALTELGFVRTTPDPEDRRAKVISITESGREHLAAARAARQRIAAELFSPLSVTERSTLHSLLSRVITQASS